jgi:hypothetical protein
VISAVPLSWLFSKLVSVVKKILQPIERYLKNALKEWKHAMKKKGGITKDVYGDRDRKRSLDEDDENDEEGGDEEVYI